MIYVNPKCKLNFTKFAQVHKPCVGYVDIGNRLDVYNSHLDICISVTCFNRDDQGCNPDLLSLSD